MLDERVKSFSQEVIDTDDNDDDDDNVVVESLEQTQPSQSQVNPMLTLAQNTDQGKRRRRGGRLAARAKRAKPVVEADDDDDLL